MHFSTNTNQKQIEIPDTLLQIFSEISSSPITILKNHALHQICSKLQKYELEDSLFQKKYKCQYNEFNNTINRMQNEENFQWEDDLMDWQFAHENLIFWKQKLNTLNSIQLNYD